MKIKNAVVAGVLALLMGNAKAELFDRGGGLIFESDLNVTWMQDANYAKDRATDAYGRMTWSEASLWAASLVYGGFDDWRLPSALNRDGSGLCIGYYCTNTEMGHLYYTALGNQISFGPVNEEGYQETTIPTPPNIGPFKNIIKEFAVDQARAYWNAESTNTNGIDFFPIDVNAGTFYFSAGYQALDCLPSCLQWAWAVRDGDVAPIPEPETYAMMLAGLGLLGLARRRKQS